MVKRIRRKDICVKCKKFDEIKAFGECIACYNARRRKIKKFEWSYTHPFCVVCKKTTYKHHAKGICAKCRYKHDAVYIALQIERNMTRVYTKKQRIEKRTKDKRISNDLSKEQKAIYQATDRGLKCPFSSDNILKKDIKVLKEEIRRVKQ